MGPKNLDPDLLSITVMHILTEINVNLVLFNNPLWSLVFTTCSWEKKTDSFVTNQILQYFKSFAFLSRLDGY